MHRRRLRLVVVANIALVLVVGWDTAQPFMPGPGPAASAGPRSAAPDSSAEPSGDVESLVVMSATFRREFGLRADDAWVREVAADPAARWNYGVPLTAAEEAELDGRSAHVNELAPVLEAYGALHPDEFAGMYVDQERGGLLVVLFSANVDEHAAAIAQLVRPGAPIELQLAPHTQADLHELMEQITADDGLPGLGVFVLETSADETSGVVQVGVSTERDDPAAVIAARHGPAIHVTVLDPTGAFLEPRGVIVGRVVDSNGRGVAAGLGDKPLFGNFGLDAVGKGTNPDGTFRLDRQLTGPWRITAFADGYADASAEVHVPPGGVVTVELVLQPPAGS